MRTGNSLSYRNSQSEIAFILRHCGARVILVDHRHTDLVPADLAGALVVVSNDSGGMDPADAYEQFLARGHRLWMERSAHGPLDWQLVPPVRDEDATSSLCYTSGTTGRPKGVETSLRGSYLAALSNVLEAQLNGDSVYLWVLPMFHCSGWTFPWAVVAAMGTQRMLRAVDYGQIWDALDQGGVTHYAGAPTVQLSVVAHPKAHRLPQRVLVQVAASAPTPTLLKKMEALNLWPMHLYGLTETYGPSCRRLYEPQWSALPLHERAAMQARQGHAYAAADEVRVVRRDMPPGVLQDVRRDGQELGEIVMRGNLVMKRYFHDEDATAAATDGGYFHTGDLAVRHPGGEVQILDRGKDIIISGGENISSLMVEEMAASHPWVAECAVVARPHDRWGECVHAFVVLDAEGLAAVRDADANAAQTVLQSLAEHCRGRMSGFAIPRYLTIVDALPKSSTGSTCAALTPRDPEERAARARGQIVAVDAFSADSLLAPPPSRRATWTLQGPGWTRCPPAASAAAKGSLASLYTIRASVQAVSATATKNGTSHRSRSLVQWLQHSRKKYCELCQHPFVFHKRYTHEMPDGTLPVLLYVRYLAWRAAVAALYMARVGVVGVSWLVVAPYVTVRMWRVYLAAADRLAGAVLPRPVATLTVSAAKPAAPYEAPAWLPTVFHGVVREFTHGWLTSMGLTLSLVLLFISLFFLRDYITTAVRRQQELEEERADGAAPEDAAPDARDPALEPLRAAALAAAQARAQDMLATDPAALLRADGVRDAELNDDDDDDDDAWVDENEPAQHIVRPAPREPRARDAWDDGAAFDGHHGYDDDDEWVDEDEDDGGAPHRAAPPAAPAPAPAAAPNPPPPPRARVLGDADLDDDDERFDDEWDDNADHFAEDLDGALQAIGLRGPWLALPQNLAVFEMLAVATMSVCVALPYALGRLLGFRVYDVVLLPAQVLRLVTDPIFELLLGGLLSAAPSEAAASSAPWSPLADVPGVRAVLDAAIALDDMTRGARLWERAMCVVLGHLYGVLLLGIEAKFGGLIHGGQTRWAETALRYYLATLKVAFFFVLDLVGFPLYCGLLLDVCALPLWQGASLMSLWAQANAAPLTFAFLRWTSGTVYMFFFAQFLSAIRGIVRPGVLCWMRDSNDPDFHPVKEILEKGTLEQLHKMGDSVVIYGALALSVLGVSVRVLRCVPGLLPLRWAPYTPRTVAPIELLLVHFALRVLLKRLRVAHHAKRGFRRWWIWAAKRVRLSAYLMGDDQPDERGHRVYASWAERARAWLGGAAPPTVPDGGFARVPADDHPAPRTSLFVRTDADGQPVDDDARAALDKQLAALDTMAVKAPYTIVYIPPHFRMRLVALFVLLWAFCVAVVAAGAGVPLGLGRLVVGHSVHDTYTVLVGYVLVTLGVLGARAALALWPTGRPGYLDDVRHGARGVARFAYHATCFGGAVPLLTGLVLHQCTYLCSPRLVAGRCGRDPDLFGVVRVGPGRARSEHGHARHTDMASGRVPTAVGHLRPGAGRAPVACAGRARDALRARPRARRARRGAGAAVCDRRAVPRHDHRSCVAARGAVAVRAPREPHDPRRRSHVPLLALCPEPPRLLDHRAARRAVPRVDAAVQLLRGQAHAWQRLRRTSRCSSPCIAPQRHRRAALYDT